MRNDALIEPNVKMQPIAMTSEKLEENPGNCNRKK